MATNDSPQGLRAPSASAVRVIEPVYVNIWTPGVLLQAELDGQMYYGEITQVEDAVDYVAVDCYRFIGGMVVITQWAGTIKEYKELWRLAAHEGAS